MQTKPAVINFSLRIPKDLRDWIAHQAVDNHRSINSEIVARLDESRRKYAEKTLDNIGK